MALERLKIFIDASASGAVREIDKVGNAASKAGAPIGGMTGKISSLKSAMSGGMGMTAAAAGIGVLVGAGVKAVEQFADLAGSVREFQRVSGTSAESASRFVAVFDDMEISQTKANAAMFKFNRDLGQGTLDLSQWGVQIAKAKDGSIDLQGTMGNLANAYKGIRDPAQRAAMLQEAFGKTGKDLIPILEKGGKALREMFASVPKGQILSQAQVDSARRMELALDNLKDAGQEIMVVLGSSLAPIVTDVANSVGDLTRGANEALGPIGGVGGALRYAFDATPVGIVSNAVGAFGNLLSGDFEGAARDAIQTVPVLGDAFLDLTGIFGEAENSGNEYADAQKRVSEAQAKVLDLAEDEKVNHKELAAAKRDLKDANQELEAKEHQVALAFDESTASARELYQATLALTNQSLGAIGSTLNYQAAVGKLGEAEAKLAQLHADGETDLAKYAAAQREVEQAQLVAAQAALKQDADLKALIDQYRNAPGGIQKVIDNLEREKQLHPEVAGAIQVQIDRIKFLTRGILDIPTSRTTRIHVESDEAVSKITNVRRLVEEIQGHKVVTVEVNQVYRTEGSPVQRRAHGGPVMATRPYLVGERGPEMFVPTQNGRILPNNQLRGGGKITVVVNAGIGTDGADVGRQVVDALKAYESRNGVGWRN